MKQALASIRFLYVNIIEKPLSKSLHQKVKKLHTLPAVLSRDEVSRLIKVTTTLIHKAILLVIYSADLRFGELPQLKDSRYRFQKV